VKVFRVSTVRFLQPSIISDDIGQILLNNESVMHVDAYSLIIAVLLHRLYARGANSSLHLLDLRIVIFEQIQLTHSWGN
jgi:hypothetical protein